MTPPPDCLHTRFIALNEPEDHCYLPAGHPGKHAYRLSPPVPIENRCDAMLVMCMRDVYGREMLLRLSKISWVERDGDTLSLVVDGNTKEVTLGTTSDAQRAFAEIKAAINLVLS